MSRFCSEALLPYPSLKDEGHWLCAPPFGVVCRSFNE
jgi:hypothetical protein